MTRFIFIHDFYRDGYSDMLAEVRELQACGQWTRHKRASLTRDTVSSYKALKHKFPRMDTSYWAGRVAALKSNRTAHFTQLESEAVEQTGNRVIYRPLPPNADRFCSLFDCGSEAIWGACLNGESNPFLVLCEPCRQEWWRLHSAYVTPDGWDWDEHEDQLDPVGNKLIVKEELQPESFFFPCSATVGFAMLDLLFHVPTPMLLPPMLLLQVVFVLHLTVKGKDYWQAFCKWIESEL